MKRSSLTAEDVAWLEQRLGQVFTPVQPRQEFVNRARMELIRQPVPAAMLTRGQIVALVGLAIAFLGLISALIALARRRT